MESVINYLKGELKMEDNIRDLLSGEISREIQALSNLNAGSKEKSTAIDDLAKLYKLRIEESKNDWEYDEKYNRRVMEEEAGTRDEEMKRTQLSEQIKDRYFRLGIAAAELMIPLMFYGIWMKKGFKFEETGTYTSTTFRGLFNRFRPTRK
ncbi:hypothetical protein [Parabacteroides goldsteinii]|uniref:hypothetical protein n=1 Tax=Parabacteroides goldsteinii TaxID=328812 RepID=UPI0026142EF8|nr:hypothetical protein [Parabacteroides goldsteinii]